MTVVPSSPSAPADHAAAATQPSTPPAPATAATASAAEAATPNKPAPSSSRDPLHGVTLEAMVVGLHTYFGWQGLAERIPVRCFQSDPSVSSSLKFLRKTPWAREKVESLYLFMLRDQRRSARP